MQGIVVLLWVLFGLLLLTGACYALLHVPARLEFRLQTDLFAGFGMLRVRHPLFACACRIRLALLSQPCLRVELLRRQGRVSSLYDARRPKPSSRGLPSKLWSSIRIDAFDVTYFVGIKDAPAAAALLAGALCSVTRAAFPVLLARFESARAAADAVPLWDCDQLRINLEGIALAAPAQIIRVILADKKEKYTYDASN